MILESGFRYLPFSGRRYAINQFGEVHDQKGEEIPSFWENGVKKVNLEWVLGSGNYELGLIVIVTFKCLRLEPYFWTWIEPLYIDGDKTNCYPVNITYRFKPGPLESEIYPGFYVVPFFTRYVINEQGFLINTETGRTLTWNQTKPSRKRNSKGGYHYLRATDDAGMDRIVFRYRLLCFVFKPYGSEVHSLITNHIDGDPTNDDLSNLEWSTYSRNNNHALNNGLREKIRPVLMKNLETGEVNWFRSACACGKHLGYVSGDPITARINQSPQRKYSDMLIFKYEDDGKDWSDIKVEQEITRPAACGETILARNAFTGDILIFESMSDAADKTGISKSNIAKHIKEEAVRPLKGYNFRYKVEGGPWPRHSKKDLEVYKENSVYGYFCKDTVEDKEYFYPSLRKASQDLGISVATLRSYLSGNPDSVHKGRYQFSRFYPWSATRSA